MLENLLIDISFIDPKLRYRSRAKKMDPLPTVHKIIQA